MWQWHSSPSLSRPNITAVKGLQCISYSRCFGILYSRGVEAADGPAGADLRVLEPLAVVGVLLRPAAVVPGVLVPARDPLQQTLCTLGHWAAAATCN